MAFYDATKEKWGYLRKTSELALKAGFDKNTGLHRNGLDEYLRVIFPDVHDWVHDKSIPNLIVNGKCYAKWPDYRSEQLKMIIEFDGLQHYTDPVKIKEDREKSEIYESFWYKVVRIPYVIQLSNEAVKVLFNITVTENLFNEKFLSLGPGEPAISAYLCSAGFIRMAQEFKRFPNQYKVNRDYLKECNDPEITCISFLENVYNRL